MIDRLRRHGYAILWALDDLLSALTGGNPGELVSARLATAKGIDHWLCRGVDWVALHLCHQPDHCRQALLAYEAREAASPFE